LKLISKHNDLQTDKAGAHKASEEAHGDATKGHLSQAQGHAKDAAKQAVGAGDAKKEQAKAGHKVFLCSCQRCTDNQGFFDKRVFHQGAGVEHDANKATAGSQKEGAKGSLAAVKVKLWLLLRPLGLCCASVSAALIKLGHTAG